MKARAGSASRSMRTTWPGTTNHSCPTGPTPRGRPCLPVRAAAVSAPIRGVVPDHGGPDEPSRDGFLRGSLNSRVPRGPYAARHKTRADATRANRDRHRQIWHKPGMIDHPTRDAGFGVYVHWPFCASKCPYCDFNSHVRLKGIDEARFLAAFRREVAHMAALAPGRTVTSVFFGGGTPSLMAPATTAALLDAIAAAWTVAPDAEITLEANPTSVEATRFAGYRVAGVNRVPLGVQALNDADLARLGRLHTAEEALAAVRIAAENFERFSFDLIYAR